MLTCSIDCPIAVPSNFDCPFACLKPYVPLFLRQVFGTGGLNIEEPLIFALDFCPWPCTTLMSHRVSTSVGGMGEEVSLGSPRPIDLI